MQIMYVDESGDPGNSIYASPHYILTGLIIDQEDWNPYLNALKILRNTIHTTYGLKPKIEFHSMEIFRTSLDAYKAIKKSDRVDMLKFYANQIPIIFNKARIINICLDKSKFVDIDNFQSLAWSRLLSTYDTYLIATKKDKGIIICDESNENLLRNQLRKSRIYNSIPSLYGGVDNVATQNIIEDITHRKSSLSLFIQTADIIAHVLYRKEFPKGSLKKYSVERLFDILDPILLKELTCIDLQGIIRK